MTECPNAERKKHNSTADGRGWGWVEWGRTAILENYCVFRGACYLMQPVRLCVCAYARARARTCAFVRLRWSDSRVMSSSPSARLFSSVSPWQWFVTRSPYYKTCPLLSRFPRPLLVEFLFAGSRFITNRIRKRQWRRAANRKYAAISSGTVASDEQQDECVDC